MGNFNGNPIALVLWIIFLLFGLWLIVKGIGALAAPANLWMFLGGIAILVIGFYVLRGTLGAAA